MSDRNDSKYELPPSNSNDSTRTATKTRPARPPIRRLPPWKVVLHNDDVNEMAYVVKTITKITTLDKQNASSRTVEAHKKGFSLLLTTHRERAELYQSQFAGCNLTVTIEPDQN